MTDKIQQTIEDMLKATKKDCKFKQAWLPKNWACVYIKTFAKELAKKLRSK